ncbi:MAG TPA: UbiD family decarboxylase [bacterium]|nr:UbiD family decarboxylase [bacterium]
MRNSSVIPKIPQDLREFIALMEREGELCRVQREVDANLEVGAITRRVIDLKERAPLFEKVRGYAQGFRLFGCVLGPTRPVLQGRVSLALGLPKKTPTLELVEEFVRRTASPIPPVMVSSSPCKKNILRGDDVDLLRFPSPRVHGIDGGPYIGSWNICVTQDPETAWVNWGLYRVMVHDRRHLGILLHPHRQHGGHMFYNRYEKRGEPMPIAIAIGTDPISTMASCASFPFNVSEVEMAGAMRGTPVPLVECETIPLKVPASSEIVIEGEVLPGERREEGPFGEYTGYSVHAEKAPVIRVTCITYRDDPILTMSNMGKPWDEASVTSSVVTSGVVYHALREAGIPFQAAYTYAPQMSIIVSAPSVPGLPLRIASALWSGRVRTDLPYLVIVNEDVDVTNIEDVWWAITTRMHPAHGIQVVEGKVVNPLIPWVTPEEREKRVTHGIIFDACFPPHWSAEYLRKHCQVVDFKQGWPPEVQEQVLKNWEQYGYGEAT